MAKRGRRPGFHHSTETRVSWLMVGHYVSDRTKDRISAAQVINYHRDLYTPGEKISPINDPGHQWNRKKLNFDVSY